MQKKKQVSILVILIVLLIIINYSAIDNFLKSHFLYEDAFVERVIDGDTLVIENKTSVRLLGINCPEKGELYYDEAKEFLENEVFNKTVKLKFGKEKYDRYNRILAYVFLDNENVNLKLVENGLANYYFPSGKDAYYNKFKEAWEECTEKNINLCKISEHKCAECIILEELDVKNQIVTLYNNCNYDCDLNSWTIKDEGRKKFYFDNFLLNKKSRVLIRVGDGTNDMSNLYWKGEDYVWTSTGDTLFLRDDKGGLVLWGGC